MSCIIERLIRPSRIRILVAPGAHYSIAFMLFLGLPFSSAGESVGPTPSTESNLLVVSATPKVTFNGGVRTRVRVGRHPDNRTLRLEIDSPVYGASSEFQMDGLDAAITYERIWMTLPAGTYRVRVTVERLDGSERVAVDEFMVKGPEIATAAPFERPGRTP